MLILFRPDFLDSLRQGKQDSPSPSYFCMFLYVSNSERTLAASILYVCVWEDSRVGHQRGWHTLLEQSDRICLGSFITSPPDTLRMSVRIRKGVYQIHNFSDRVWYGTQSSLCFRDERRFNWSGSARRGLGLGYRQVESGDLPISMMREFNMTTISSGDSTP